MSQQLLDQLTKQPDAKVADLPDAHEWAEKFLGRAISLEPTQTFLSEILRLCQEEHPGFDVCHWDPYEEGFDDGPGDLTDSWHTEDSISTGQ